MTHSLQDRYKTTITNTPGTTGGFILGAPVSNFLSWSSGDDGNTFDIVVDNGTNFEVCANCVYTQSSHSLSRGNFIKSNTGSPINWDGSPTVSNVYIAERMAAFNITSPAPGDSLYWNGSFWINETLEPLPPAILLEGLADVSIIPGTQVAGQVLEWDGAAWTNYTLPTYSLETLTDVVITTPSIGDTIKWTGTDWVNITLSSSNLSDFGLASPSAGQVLQYNGTKWQNLNLSVPWTAVTGAPSLFTPVITSPTSGQDLTYNGTNWVNTNKTIAFSAVTSKPTTLSGYGITDGVSTTTIASYAPLASPALTGSPTSVTATAGSNNTGIATNAFVYTAISGLPLSSTNVSIASPTTNQVLQYNGTNWVNANVSTSSTTLAALTDCAITSPSSGDLLRWNGSKWANYTNNYITGSSPTISSATLTGTTSVGSMTMSTGVFNATAGTITITTPSQIDNSGNVASTAFVHTAISNAGILNTTITSPTSGQDLTYNGTNWVNTNKTIAFSAVTSKPTTLSGYGITDGVSTTTIASYAPLASPALTGSPTSVTATAGSNNTGIATNAFVYTAISGLPLSSTNVSIASPTTNQVLQYNGTNWVNSTSTLTDTRLAAPTPSTAPTAGSTGMAIGSGASSAGSTSIAFGISAAAGSTSAIAIGNNTGTTLTTSPYSIAIGNLSGGTDGSVTLGYQCLANGGVGDAKHSVAIGYKAKAVLHGQVSLGEDALPGSNTSITRYSIIKLSNQTTNATQTNLFLDGTAGTQRLLASSGSMIMAFYIMVVARSTSGAGQAAWKIEGAYSTYGGGAALFGTPTVTALGTPPSGWAVAVTADTVNTGLNVLVTGAASTNINWFATCELTELQ